MGRTFCAALLLPTLAMPLAAYTRGEASVRSWRNDLAYLKTEAPKRHKNLFHDLQPEAFARLVDDLSRRVPSLQDYEIVVGIARIVAQIGPRDGHTYMSLLDPSLRFHRLPLNFYAYLDGVHIRAASKEHADLVGAKLIAIGAERQPTRRLRASWKSPPATTR